MKYATLSLTQERADRHPMHRFVCESPAVDREVLLEGEEAPLEHGNGIGLWLVNWIVTRSGGRIAFDENDPRGRRVTLVLSPPD